MSYEAITLERGLHGLVTISLNDPSRHNALNPMMIDELTRVANDLAALQTLIRERRSR